MHDLVSFFLSFCFVSLAFFQAVAISLSGLKPLDSDGVLWRERGTCTQQKRMLPYIFPPPLIFLLSQCKSFLTFDLYWYEVHSRRERTKKKKERKKERKRRKKEAQE